MNYLLIIITILFLCVLTYLSLNHKEPFITYIKDKQLIGTIDRNGMEDNRYPLSSYRNNEKLRRNEEICYGTLNVKPNTINPNDRGLCPKNGSARHKGSDDREYKILEGERTPTLGMHAIDFSNYETYYEREIKKSRPCRRNRFRWCLWRSLQRYCQKDFSYFFRELNA
jgi:hypothetical protein